MRWRLSGKSLSMGVAGLVMATAVTLGTAGQAAAAPPVAFPVGPGLVFVAQDTNTLLNKAVQGVGAISFSAEGPRSGGRYNAMGFNIADRYLYAMRSPDSRNLLRIGVNGVVEGAGAVAGLPVADYNQGTIGPDGTMYVREYSPNPHPRLYRFNVAARVATLVTLSASVPNLSDIVWKDGYLWGVFEGTRIYRMNPVTGAVDSFPLTGIETGEAFGAQWLYGNGNLGISNNISGNIYQIDVADPTAATPTFTTLSRIRGPGSLNNDGASDPGLPANLRVEKDAPATFVAGGRVAYSITVHNDGPGVSSGWVVTDTIPAGLTDVTAVAPACTIAANVITCSGPSLAVGQAATVTFSGTTPDPSLPPPDGCITNTADVVGNEPEPIPDPGSNTSTATTCPGLVGVRSFAVQKNASPAVAHPGDLVTYRITVQNTGSEAFVDPDLASFTDDLTGVVDDATFDEASITGGASYDDSTSVLSWSGPLAVGQLAVISYQVRVNPTPLDYSLVNVVVPGPDGECIADAQCGTTIPVAAFRVVKVALTAPPVFPGQRVDYQITVENLGQFAYTTETPASFTEDLTDVLGDAALDEASITGGATYAAPDLSWSGALPVGPTPVTITYAATVKNPDTGDKTMVNTVVTPPDSGGNCPAGSIDPDCAATVPIMNYTVAKASTVDQSNPAAIVVRYAITVTNNGVTAYSAEQPATFTDDLSAVLDDATYNDDASAGSYAAPKLSWSGALAAGASVTVTYSVTVNNPDLGDHRLRNVVVPDPTSGGACLTATACTTYLPILTPQPPTSTDGDEPVAFHGGNAPLIVTGDELAYTGYSIGGFLLLAVLLITAGLALRRVTAARRE